MYNCNCAVLNTPKPKPTVGEFFIHWHRHRHRHFLSSALWAWIHMQRMSETICKNVSVRKGIIEVKLWELWQVVIIPNCGYGMLWGIMPICEPWCWILLATKLGDFERANVGIHIPAPWFASGKQQTHKTNPPKKKSRRTDDPSIKTEGPELMIHDPSNSGQKSGLDLHRCCGRWDLPDLPGLRGLQGLRGLCCRRQAGRWFLGHFSGSQKILADVVFFWGYIDIIMI